MRKRDMKRTLRRARSTLARMDASLANAEIFAGERRGHDVVMRILRDTHDGLAELDEAVRHLLGSSHVHSIPFRVLDVLDDGGLESDEVREYVRALLVRGQNGATIQGTAAALGISQKRMAKALHDANLRNPSDVSDTSTFLTAVAMLQEGKNPEVVASQIGYSSSMSMSNLLVRFGGFRIKAARQLTDFDALLTDCTNRLWAAR